jgi:hypothetical protein
VKCPTIGNFVPEVPINFGQTFDSQKCDKKCPSFFFIPGNVMLLNMNF